MLLFADDALLMSCSATGLQNQLNILKQEADKLELKLNLDKTNIIVFRSGGYLSHRERWWYMELNKLKLLMLIHTWG